MLIAVVFVSLVGVGVDVCVCVCVCVSVVEAVLLVANFFEMEYSWVNVEEGTPYHYSILTTAARYFVFVCDAKVHPASDAGSGKPIRAIRPKCPRRRRWSNHSTVHVD
jgi:hypothetical protein